MVKVGIAGLGFMGVTHYRAWEHVAGAKVVALCESNRQRLAGDWTDVQGNFGGSGGRVDVSDLACYEDFAAFVADPNLDLVDICLPTGAHRSLTITALQAGKHVQCEKPIALTVEDADAMVAAARAADRFLTVGQVLRFWPEWLYLKRAVDSGEWGKLLSLNVRRIISAPDWSAEIRSTPANGGPMIDLHIHDTDFVLYLLGKPARVFATGKDEGAYVSYVSAVYEYPGGPVVTCQSGAIAAKARPFCHGYEASFEHATLAFAAATEPAGLDPGAQRGASQALTVYKADGTVEFPTPPATEAFSAELGHAAQCVATGTRSTLIDGQIARDALALVYCEVESVRSGQVVTVP
jgi:predicted dehydrogenase